MVEAWSYIKVSVQRKLHSSCRSEKKIEDGCFGFLIAKRDQFYEPDSSRVIEQAAICRHPFQSVQVTIITLSCRRVQIAPGP